VENDLRIHITPEDWLVDIDEIPDGSEPRSRCRYYIEPSGPFGLNEVCEANYYTGNTVPYHEHAEGFETFLVDGGAIEVISGSRRATAKKGDIVHIMPYTPHAIRTLEDESIWRAFHQGMYMVRGMLEERRLRDEYPKIWGDPAFRKDNAARYKSIWFDYGLPAAGDIRPDSLRELRAFDFGLSSFSFGGMTMRLKVGRWETGGAKEVWQFVMGRGCRLSWEPGCPFTQLYDVFSGSVEVRLDGMTPFAAKARDLLHIPRFTAGSIKALEDTVLFDFGCRGFLLRFMDELHVCQVREPDKLDDRAFIRRVMKKHDCHVFFEPPMD
jgi:mannose-6-phosphate isomerase-like protein (cupin superfamily)